MTMKKWISIFLSVLMLLAMVGCGQSAGRTENQENSSDSENVAFANQQEAVADDTAGSGELTSVAGNTNIDEEGDSPVVYMTTDSAEDGASLVNRIETRNGLHTLEQAEKIGLGSRAYQLVSIDE